LFQAERLTRFKQCRFYRSTVLRCAVQFKTRHVRHAMVQRAFIFAGNIQITQVKKRDSRQSSAIGFFNNLYRIRIRSLDLKPTGQTLLLVAYTALVTRYSDVIAAGLCRKRHPVRHRRSPDSADFVLCKATNKIACRSSKAKQLGKVFYNIDFLVLTAPDLYPCAGAAGVGSRRYPPADYN
jgi:hypothetical protein